MLFPTQGQSSCAFDVLSYLHNQLLRSRASHDAVVDDAGEGHHWRGRPGSVGAGHRQHGGLRSSQRGLVEVDRRKGRDLDVLMLRLGSVVRVKW